METKTKTEFEKYLDKITVNFPEYIYEYRCLRCGAIINENIEHLHSHNCLDGGIGYLQEIGKRQVKVKGIK